MRSRSKWAPKNSSMAKKITINDNILKTMEFNQFLKLLDVQFVSSYFACVE